MAGLPWFELDVDFPESPKCLALAHRLKEPLAEAYLVRLWAYCYRHASDRFKGESAPSAVEGVARWRGRPGQLVAALVAVGSMEHDGDDLVVHGVRDRLDPHLKKRTRDVERLRTKRAQVADGIGDVVPMSPRRRRDD